MRVAAYIRVSTDGQCGDDKFGLDSQKEMIKKYCDERDMVITKWFADEGESGAKERPGFDSIIYGEDFTNPPFEALIVAKSDRVARDINIYYYYKMMLKKKNITLISVSEDFGQMGMFAPMLEAFTLCVAEMERQNITKRTSGGRVIKASKGGYSGGATPTGYKAVAGKLVIVEEEAKVVRRIFELRATGMSLQDIADTLTDEGYKARKGNYYRIGTVKSILDNERTYRGEYKYSNGEWVKGEQEPILQ